MLWKIKPNIEQLNTLSTDTMMSTLGIEVLEIGDDFITAKMPTVPTWKNKKFSLAYRML